MPDLSDQKIQRILELSENNNKLLRSIKRAIWVGRVTHIIYWVILIGASIGAFWFLKPYISQLNEVYGGLKNGVNSVNNLNTEGINTLLKSLGR